MIVRRSLVRMMPVPGLTGSAYASSFCGRAPSISGAICPPQLPRLARTNPGPVVLLVAAVDAEVPALVPAEFVADFADDPPEEPPPPDLLPEFEPPLDDVVLVVVEVAEEEE